MDSFASGNPGEDVNSASVISLATGATALVVSAWSWVASAGLLLSLPQEEHIKQAALKAVKYRKTLFFITIDERLK
jgi:hypothetical protein